MARGAQCLTTSAPRDPPRATHTDSQSERRLARWTDPDAQPTARCCCSTSTALSPSSASPPARPPRGRSTGSMASRTFFRPPPPLTCRPCARSSSSSGAAAGRSAPTNTFRLCWACRASCRFCARAGRPRKQRRRRPRGEPLHAWTLEARRDRRLRRSAGAGLDRRLPRRGVPRVGRGARRADAPFADARGCRDRRGARRGTPALGRRAAALTPAESASSRQPTGTVTLEVYSPSDHAPDRTHRGSRRLGGVSK